LFHGSGDLRRPRRTAGATKKPVQAGSPDWSSLLEEKRKRSDTGGNVTAYTGIQAVALIAQAAAALATGTEAMVFRICEAIW